MYATSCPLKGTCGSGLEFILEGGMKDEGEIAPVNCFSQDYN